MTLHLFFVGQEFTRTSRFRQRVSKQRCFLFLQILRKDFRIITYNGATT